ncbi:site-2 protease family protein [Spartinivicinus poritis]|uniref:Site-2 protease family protein n=1 Tax=Spartinivicinus poritis TaxID=2994640 RepID=A0ABT5UD18_9GAMM|nr:site-2 protease family protein [Spartinivicinus sp. A2-2]MDE1464276.1 site-2 protease family protein [Spartinivicinus sp. A2-2]
MEILNLTLLGHPLRLEGTMSGWQRLYWDHQIVSEVAATAEADGDTTHTFELHGEQGVIKCCISVSINWHPFALSYSITINDQIADEGKRTIQDLEHSAPQEVMPIKKELNLVGLASLGFKLFKSAKVIKVVLAGASVAAYSWFFSLQFALALIACLVFHEYGHIRAMKYFGMKTKGIYLIPFFGGLALGDDKINTRWQDVVISIMGPSFGLFLSIVCLVLYKLTGEIFFAGLAGFNALLNLFNLLPILPLDGGHILKSISFSMDSKVGIAACALGAGLGVFLSYQLGLALLGFLLLIGSVEILAEWRLRHESRLYPLDGYGQLFSLVWYLLTVSSLISIIWFLSGTGDALLGLPLQVLQS